MSVGSEGLALSEESLDCGNVMTLSPLWDSGSVSTLISAPTETKLLQSAFSRDHRVTFARHPEWGVSNRMPDGLQGKRLLLVEDNADIQAFVSTVARLEGADIVTASKGEEGLSILSGESQVDLVLLDLNLPGIQGWDVLREIGDATDARPPVVVFSAYTDAPTRKRAADMGAMGFIAKPIGARELVNKLEAFLSQL